MQENYVITILVINTIMLMYLTYQYVKEKFVAPTLPKTMNLAFDKKKFN